MCATLTPFFYWKLWVSIEERQRAYPEKLSKMPKMYQILDFHCLKSVYKMLKLGIFSVLDNIFTENILEMWEKRGDLFPMWEYFSLPSELVSQYSCSKNPPETEDIDRKHENDAKTYGPVLTYGQCFFVDKCLIGASDWFCNLKDSVLC